MFNSTKIITLGSCAFRQPRAKSRCRLIHGYRLQAKVWITCKELDENNWVFDFGSFKPLKLSLENQFDHTTCISADDPELDTFENLNEKSIIDLRIFNGGVGIEKFAEYVYEATNTFVLDMTHRRCWCSKVEVWEHPENSAIYEPIGILNPSCKKEI